MASMQPIDADIASLSPLSAAALGAAASTEDRQAALAMAVINDLVEPARLCLEAGADASAFLPVHRHCTPLHNAALNDHVDMARLLIAHGARTDIHDTLWDSTAPWDGPCTRRRPTSRRICNR